MTGNMRLELTWTDKYQDKNIEPRILVEDIKKSNLSKDKNPKNMLIHGDNLLVLKSLEEDFSGKIKCVYIDPPYNTGNAFEHYDDGLEHSIWLNLMQSRLKIISKLLSDDGLIAVQIDDNEYARLYLLMAEIFGERNLKTVCIKMSEPTGVKMASVNKAGSIPKLKEYIIIAKKDGIKNIYLEKTPKEKWDKEYKTFCDNVSDQELEELKRILNEEDFSEEDSIIADQILSKIVFRQVNDYCKMKTGKAPTKEWLFENAHRIVQFATLTGGARDIAIEKKNRYTRNVPSAFLIITKQRKKYAIKGDFNTNTKLSRCKILFADIYLEVNIGDLWTDIKTTGLDNEGVVEFKNGKKPEKLLKRIINMNTKEGDYVLDSFLGSGTTAAVAHKMNRRWIGIELGNHAYTHCKVRLDSVISGEDQGGISKSVAWSGGGGYKFYELAPSLFEKHDVLPIYKINMEYTFEMLCEAICKLEGFRYAPQGEMHGKSSETRFIHIASDMITGDYIRHITKELSEHDSVLIYGTKIQSNLKLEENIEIKRIPNDILKKFDFESEVK